MSLNNPLENAMLDEVLRSGAYPEEIAALIRQQMTTPANDIMGEPLSEEEALAGWEVTDLDIAQAQADWIATAPDWAVLLLDAKPAPQS